MIDAAECLFFINTEHSITPNQAINSTRSSWIFSELSMSRLLKKNIPQRWNRRIRSFSDHVQLNEGFMAFEAKLNHLREIDQDDLRYWELGYTKPSSPDPEKALDALYLRFSSFTERLLKEKLRIGLLQSVDTLLLPHGIRPKIQHQ